MVTGEIHDTNAAAMAAGLRACPVGAFVYDPKKIVSGVHGKAFERLIGAGSFYLRDSLCKGWFCLHTFAPSVPVGTGTLPWLRYVIVVFILWMRG